MNLSELTKSQKDAVTYLDSDLIVSAGAGTGKTRVLVNRFLFLVVEKGIGVDDILALTFTEKAAAEMKKRISEAFEKEDRVNEKRLVENAYISTIHGFCARLLRENPFEAGIDPDFVVIDDINRLIMMEEIFDEILESGNEELADLIDRYDEKEIRGALLNYIFLNRCLGRKPERIKEILKQKTLLNDNLREKIDKILFDMQEKVIDKAKALENFSTDGEIENYRTEILSIVRELDKSKPKKKVLSSLYDYFSEINLRAGRRNDEDCKSIKDIIKNIKECLTQYKIPDSSLFEINNAALEEDINKNIIPFLKVALKFWENYNKRKYKEGMLDYEDLEIITRDLLTDNETVRNDYKSKFKHILIDEFQDINTIQKEILEILKPKDGFFIVGDIRQSIFGFRNAEVRIMKDYRKKFENGKGKCIELNENFRSSKNILHFVNQFFNNVWADDGGNQPLEKSRKEPPNHNDDANVELILVTNDPDDPQNNQPDSERLIEVEAENVAFRINELIEGEYKILDKESNQWRPVTFRDIAILVRRRNAYDNYAKVFGKHKIPFSMHRSMRLFSKHEIQDILAFLSIIDNSRNDIDFAAVLRSPFCDLSDDAFVLIRDYANKNKKLKSPYIYQTLTAIAGEKLLSDKDELKIKSFLSLYNQLRNIKDLVPLYDIFDILMKETDYEVKTATLYNGERGLANIQRFREIIVSHTRLSSASIKSFLDFCECIENWGDKEEPEIETGLENKVTFITVHSAKGLEFPVVFLVNMAQQTINVTSKIIVSKDLDAGFKIYGLENEKDSSSLHRIIIAKEKKEAELDEEKRLLYVAMTRARDRLILAGIMSLRNVESFIKILKENLIEKLSDPLPIEGEINFGHSWIKVNKIRGSNTKTASTPSSFIEKIEEYIEKEEKIPEKIIQPVNQELRKHIKNKIEIISKIKNFHAPYLPDRLSAVSLALYDKCPRMYYIMEILNLPDKNQIKNTYLTSVDEISPLEIGGIVHSILERIDYNDAPQKQIKDFLKKYNLNNDYNLLICGMIDNYFKSDIAQEVKKSSRILREVPFTLFISEIPVHGRIDLLYEMENSDFRLIDFKTNKLDVDNLEGERDKYRLQIDLYALAISKLNNIRVSEGIIYFMRPNRILKYDYNEDKLNNCDLKIKSLIEGIKKQNFLPRDSEKCKHCDIFNLYCRYFGQV